MQWPAPAAYLLGEACWADGGRVASCQEARALVRQMEDPSAAIFKLLEVLAAGISSKMHCNWQSSFGRDGGQP